MSAWTLLFGLDMLLLFGKSSSFSGSMLGVEAGEMELEKLNRM